MRETFLQAGGVRIFLREQGRGSPVLLLHGFPETGRCWDAVAARLAARHRVLVPDLPGFGRSDPPPAYDAAAVAAVLVDLLDAAGVERAAVCGHDWGGSFAFRLALDFPERVERLAVTNAPFRKMDFRRGFHFLAFNLPLLPEAALMLGGRWLVPLMIQAASARPDAVDPEAMGEYQAAYGSLGRIRSALAYYRTVTRAVLVRTLRARVPIPGSGARPGRGPRAVTVPTLIVWGMKDPVLPPSLIETIEADIPHAKVVRLDDCGHFVPEECPDALAGALESFLT